MDVPVCAACGSRLVEVDPHHDDLIGTVIDNRYEIRDRLGEGGMGMVYRAWQRSIGREVAIKLIDRRFSRDVMAVRRFLREARLASQLSQPNTVSVFDFGQCEDGRLFIAMELIRGLTLDEVMGADGPFSVARAARVGVQLCDALQAAHSLQIVHRDLKLSNIIVLDDPPGRDLIKVLDFGLAKSLGDDESAGTQTGLVVGTPRYMSPEAAAGASASPASDLYAVGVILGELTTGKYLWEATSFTQLIAQKIEGTSRRDEIPAPIRSLVLRLIHPEPDRRPRSATALRQELLALLDGSVPDAKVTAPLGVRRAAPVAETVELTSSPGLAPAGEPELAPAVTAPQRGRAASRSSVGHEPTVAAPSAVTAPRPAAAVADVAAAEASSGSLVSTAVPVARRRGPPAMLVGGLVVAAVVIVAVVMATRGSSTTAPEAPGPTVSADTVPAAPVEPAPVAAIVVDAGGSRRRFPPGSRRGRARRRAGVAAGHGPRHVPPRGRDDPPRRPDRRHRAARRRGTPRRRRGRAQRRARRPHHAQVDRPRSRSQARADPAAPSCRHPVRPRRLRPGHALLMRPRPALIAVASLSLALAAALARAGGDAATSDAPWIFEPGPEVDGAADAAKADVTRAQKLAKQNKYRDAVTIFEQVARAHPSAVHDCNLALAYLRAGVYTRAQLVWEISALRNADRPNWCISTLGEQLSTALRSAGFVPVTLAVSPPDAVIEIGGVAVRNMRVVWLAPGHYAVSATAPDREPGTTEVDVSSSSSTVTLELARPHVEVPDVDAGVVGAEADAGPTGHGDGTSAGLDTIDEPDLPPMPPAPAPTVRWPGWAGVGVAGVAVVTGAIFHVKALDTRDQANQLPVDEPQFGDLLDEFKGQRTIAISGYVVGALAAGFGAWWLAAHPAAHDGPRVGVSVGAGGGGVTVEWALGGPR
ncbi:MAG: protein kinase [Kofleriaceae bacterium]|nr:protein kinase [Kofleriaceae bacterium]